MRTHDRVANYRDARSVRTSGKQANLPAAPSPKSVSPPIQVLVPIEGQDPAHPLPINLRIPLEELQKTLDSLRGHKLSHEASAADEWRMEGEDLGSRQAEDCHDFIQDGQFAIPGSP